MIIEKKISYIFIVSIFLFSLSRIQAQKKYWSLKECVDLSYEKNISIKQIELQLENANIEKSNAKANFFPNLNASLNHSWNYGLNQNITTGILENMTTQFSSMGLNMGVDIYKGLENIKRLHRANLSIIAEQYKIDDIKDDIGLLVANSYLQIMFNREILEVQKQQLEVSKKDLERTKALVDAGILVKGDLYDIEASLATQEQSLIQADNAYRLVKINLAQLLRIDDYENFEILNENFDVPFSNILDETPKAIFSKALIQRNDIKLSITNIEIAETDIELAKVRLQPSISAYYGYNSRVSYNDRLKQTGQFETVPIGYLSSSSEPVLTQIEKREVVGPISIIDQLSLNDGHNFGIQLSVPIFNRFVAKNNIKRSKVNLEAVKNQHEQTKLDLENTINQAFNNTVASYKFYEATIKTVSARKDAFDNAKNKFEAGVINSYDYAQIKQRYESAVSDKVRAKFDYIFKLKVLEFYFGLNIDI
ncbi:MAG: TolC family protein [Flavobacteriaceae bacterium]|nr:TolC family protein [Flavobacteriaceae bacterium]